MQRGNITCTFPLPLFRSRLTLLTCSATTFGPRPRLIVSKLPLMLAAFVPDQPPFPFEEEEKSTVIWELTKMQDVWSMDCAENSVIVGESLFLVCERRDRLMRIARVGGSQQIVYAADVINPEFRTIPTPGKSDALSVCQLNIVRSSLLALVHR
jgi:hypothetical protein